VLLNLTNESDIDELSTVMELMIEHFGEEMAPFAFSLCSQLVFFFSFFLLLCLRLLVCLLPFFSFFYKTKTKTKKPILPYF